MSDEKQKVIVIVGATGSGKSDLAMRCAREFSGEMICADSRTVYRGMDVGTAKKLPASSYQPQALAHLIPHYLLDIRNPDQSYSAAEFKEDAERCIRDIAGRGRLPIVVGGTMLYVRVLVDNLNLAGAQPNPQRRAELERMSLAELQKILTSRDPDATDTVDAENPRRLIRAIETIEATGLSLAVARATHESPYDFRIIGLDVPREDLHRRIAARTHAMFACGLVAETQRLLAQYGPDIEPLRGVVYREVIDLLQSAAGGERVQQTEDRINAALRRYARRQLAWWRKDARVRWVRTYEEAREVVGKP